MDSRQPEPDLRSQRTEPVHRGRQSIRARDAHYVLCVKNNHPKLADSILFVQAGIGGAATCSQWEQVQRGHGRHEVRRCWACDAVDRLHEGAQWAGLASFAVVERERTVGDKRTLERRYYISSLPAGAARIARAVRSHWQVENRLHGCLDVPFGDDAARARTGNAACNLAATRHFALNALRLHPKKASLKVKRLLAATSDQFRNELVGVMT